MNWKKITTATLLSLTIVFLSVHLLAQQTSPTISPTQAVPVKPKQVISYVKEGALWLVNEDGTEDRRVVPAPEDATIGNQIWSKDGSKIYFNLGGSLQAYNLKEQKVEAYGKLELPEGLALDRLELSNDGVTLLAQTIDTNDALNTVPKVFAVALNPMQARELSVDEYHLLASTQSTIVRNAGDLSVSPDGRYVLFAEAADKDIQLYISDIETGNRRRVTDLNLLDGFEANAMADGGRRIIEATWSPDGKRIVFVPAQTCSEFGMCSGKMYLVDAWGGAQLQLAIAPIANLSQEWNSERSLLVYDDNGQVVVSDTLGQLKKLAEGNQPKWQPVG